MPAKTFKVKLLSHFLSVNNSTNGKFTIFGLIFIVIFTIIFSIAGWLVGDDVDDPSELSQGPPTSQVLLMSCYGLALTCNFLLSSEARVFLKR